ncbi:MAG TPA: hypothetical protein VH165_31645 [Kofleriaceae bacterium]|jgi:hypothetical protein|nr:hypothetical protein [Kofleriaceae bacterium]
MYDADAIEALNFEQLATITDRLLFRSRSSRRLHHVAHHVSNKTPNHELDLNSLNLSGDRFSIPSLAPVARRTKPACRISPPLTLRGSVFGPTARGSSLNVAAPVAPPAGASEERTIVVHPLGASRRSRIAHALRSPAFAARFVIPALVGAVLGLATML